MTYHCIVKGTSVWDRGQHSPHRVQRPFSLGGKTMEYWRKHCQNPMFYQLVSTMEKSDYPNDLDDGKCLHNHIETIEEIGKI
jgi:hypothetical protein